MIDYDLLRNPLDSFLTGEAVAYLTRCFSTCGLIIGINQPPLIDFDLTLRGRPTSFADLNITEKNLNNPGLWGGEWQGFRPWYWPNLPVFWASFERRIADVKEALDAPIWKVLGFDRYTFDILPRSMSDFFGAEPAEVTFHDFVRKSGNGLKAKDTKSDDCAPEVLARIGAARISKWLERLVLPGQDILVDAPHLVSRFPSLISGDAGDIRAWNTTARLGSHDKPELDAGIIEEYRLKKNHWLSRPVWFWDGLRSCERIQEVREPWTVQMPDWVFCEDASAVSTTGSETAIVCGGDRISVFPSVCATVCWLRLSSVRKILCIARFEVTHGRCEGDGKRSTSPLMWLAAKNMDRLSQGKRTACRWRTVPGRC